MDSGFRRNDASVAVSLFWALHLPVTVSSLGEASTNSAFDIWKA